jgi:uncharacterized membrane protein YdjX (TVP38/TMEM64 family)
MEQLIVDLLRGSSGLGPLGLVLLAVSFFVISLTFIPRAPACIVSGVVYGISAFPVVLVASTLGAVAGFLISRQLFRARFCQIIERRLNWRSIIDAIDSQGWIVVMLLRLASPVPGTLTTYLLGMTGIRLWPYIGTTFFGIAPQTFLFVLMGAVGPAAIEGGPLSVTRFVFVLAGVLTSVVFVWLIGRQARASLSTRLTHASQRSQAHVE